MAKLYTFSSSFPSGGTMGPVTLGVRAARLRGNKAGGGMRFRQMPLYATESGEKPGGGRMGYLSHMLDDAMGAEEDEEEGAAKLQFVRSGGRGIGIRKR